MNLTQRDIDRFWSRVDKTGECWIWTGYRGAKGYGQITIGNRSVRTHRVSFRIAHGYISEKAFICHRCDNPPCVRPDHLFEGDVQINTADMMRKNRAVFVNGSAHGMAKLDEAKVEEIRDLLKTGASLGEIANRYGVTKDAIYCIREGRTWKKSFRSSTPAPAPAPDKLKKETNL